MSREFVEAALNRIGAPDVPDRGDIVWASLNPVQGHEQAGHRPHLVVSRRQYQEAFGLLVVVPMTHSNRNWPSRVEIVPGSYAICEQPRTISVTRVTKVETRGLVHQADQAAAIINRIINF